MRIKKEKGADGQADSSKTNIYIEPDEEFPVKAVHLTSQIVCLIFSCRIEMRSSQRIPSQKPRKPKWLHTAAFRTVFITDLYTLSLEMTPG